jgi:hypothetical protein
MNTRYADEPIEQIQSNIGHYQYRLEATIKCWCPSTK